MRIAIDIDSTLHHYWDQLSDALLEHYGIEVPYESQVTWHVPGLEVDQVRAAVLQTHSPEVIASSEPYPGAVDAVNRWHADGHFIHITSHRPQDSHDATERWLDAIGLRYDELYCSYDKITKCREIGIELLVDDSPVNLEKAIAAGLRAATILHPWNRELVETSAVIGADDWPELALALAPILDGHRPR